MKKPGAAVTQIPVVRIKLRSVSKKTKGTARKKTTRRQKTEKVAPARSWGRKNRGGGKSKKGLEQRDTTSEKVQEGREK